jgi:predicted PurR-regulated permease PerM
VNEPDAREPRLSEPDAREPGASEPRLSELDAREPRLSEPDAREPRTSEPDAREPRHTDPIARAVRLAFTWALASLSGIWLLAQLWPILVLLIAALILVGTLNPIVRGLERRGRSRTAALALVFLVFVVTAAGIAFVTLPALWAQLTQFVERAPALQMRVGEWLSHSRLTRPWGRALERFRLTDLVPPDGSKAFAFSATVAELVGGVGTTLVLALYLLADRDRASGALYAAVPRRLHVRLARVLANLEVIVGGYMRGQVITSAAMALFVFALLKALRVEGALALAVFAGLVDVIPFIGALLAIAPTVAASLSHGTVRALIAGGALLVYQEIESRVLIPRIYGRVLRLPPAAVVLALLVGGRLLGILGALLALPIAAGLRMLIEELQIELPDQGSDE